MRRLGVACCRVVDARARRTLAAPWGRAALAGLKALAWWAALGAAAACPAVGSRAAAREADGPPNIVLILSDDQAWSDYGFVGHPHIQTPRIDRLAAQSLTFTRGYVPNSLCRPSLATILTGLYPHQHGIVANDPPKPALDEARPPKNAPAEGDPRAPYLRHIDRAPKLPELLKAKGYLSFQSGKWWEGHHTRGGFTHGMTHGDARRGGRHGDLGLTIGRQGLQPIFDFIDLAGKEQKPFLVWYAPMLPHTPHTPPPRLLAKYEKLAPSPPLAKYWAMCEWFDETVGALLDHLDERRLADNTLVIYVADNGWINLPDKSAYAPRSKRSPYEGGVRTPMIVRWPARLKPRRDDARLAGSIDIAPTVLAAAGAAAPQELPGVNLLDDAAVTARERLFGGVFTHDARHLTDPLPGLRSRWVIEGDWKLIVPRGPRQGDETEAPGEVELFHLKEDPTEKHNLAAREPGRVEALRARLDAWWPAAK